MEKDNLIQQVQTIDALMTRFAVAKHTFERECDEVGEAFCKVSRPDRWVSPFATDKRPTDVQAELCEQVKRWCAKTLADGPFEIPDHTLRERGVVAPDAISEGSLVRYAGAILAAYPDQEAQQDCYKQAVSDITRTFSFKPGTMKTVGGRVVLNIRVWTESYTGKRTLNYNYQLNLATLARGMTAFAGWHGDPAIAEAFRILQDLHARHREVISREKFALPAGIEVVTFYSRFEVRLPVAVATALNRFLALYGYQEAA